VQSAIVPDEAVKPSGNATTAAVGCHILHYCFAYYALPAWGDFLSVELKNRINSFFKRLKRCGYINCTIAINDLIDRSDYELFKKVCSTSHYLHHLLPPYRTSDLHVCGHPFPVT